MITTAVRSSEGLGAVAEPDEAQICLSAPEIVKDKTEFKMAEGGEALCIEWYTCGLRIR